MRKILSLLLAGLCLAWSCNKDPQIPQEDPAPTAISLSGNSFTSPQEGETIVLTVTAPSRPQVSGLPAWIKLTDGTFAKYQISYTLKVAANDTYEERSAQMSVSAGDVSPVSFTVTQAAKAKEEEPTPPDDDTKDNDAWKMAATLGLGWNLGNQLDAYYNWSGAGDKYLWPDETVWGNPKATQQTFDKVKSYGFTSVRIPVTWLGAIGPAPDYTIDAAYMARVTEVVGYAHNAGLNVIVNTHHDENHGDDHWLNLKDAPGNAALNTQIKSEITAVWTQIAGNFKDCGDWLYFEGFNELNDGGWGWSSAFRANPYAQCNVLNEWQQTFVDAVRATGGNNAARWLGISTYCANPEYEKYLTMPTDPAGHLMLSVHFYDPSDYTIGDAQYSDWGHTGDPGKKASYGDEDHVRAVFGNLCSKYVAKNIPVYVGEFGCSMRAKSDTRAWAFYKYYMEYVVKAAKTFGLPCFVWDNGGEEGAGKEHHSYINHGTGNFMGYGKEIVDVMKKAWFTESESYTLETVYNSAPRF